MQGLSRLLQELRHLQLPGSAAAQGRVNAHPTLWGNLSFAPVGMNMFGGLCCRP